MVNRIAGIGTATIGGTAYNLVGKANYSPGNITRETMIGQDAVHGTKEMPRAPYMSCTLRDAYGMSVDAFNAMTSETVVFQLANGKVIIGQGMWTVDAQEVETEDASFEVKFEGLSGSVTEN